MKLISAKCPSCGANIEIDKDSNRTMCEYCHTQILVEDAIDKIKIEHSGTVKFEGIKTEEDKLDIVRNAEKLGDYDKMEEILMNILSENPYHLGAYKYLVQTRTQILKNICDNVFKFNFDKLDLSDDDATKKVLSLIYEYEHDDENFNHLINHHIFRTYLNGESMDGMHFIMVFTETLEELDENNQFGDFIEKSKNIENKAENIFNLYEEYEKNRTIKEKELAEKYNKKIGHGILRESRLKAIIKELNIDLPSHLIKNKDFSFVSIGEKKVCYIDDCDIRLVHKISRNIKKR